MRFMVGLGVSVLSAPMRGVSRFAHRFARANLRAPMFGLLLVGWIGIAAQARAQERSMLLAEAPTGYGHSGGAVREPLVQPGPLAHERIAVVKQRRARLVLAVGLGLTLSAGAHLAIVRPTRYCGGDREPNWSRNAAWALGGAGLALALAGGAWLAWSTLRAGFQRPSRAQRWITVAAGSAAVAAAQAPLLFLWGFGSVCSS